MPQAVSAVKPWHRSFLAAHRLPEAYLDSAIAYFEPLAEVLARRQQLSGSTLCVALNGSQGSGKSTLADYLCHSLKQEHELSAVALSLDDFYLTQAERAALAGRVHPLLRTRGVPGTHDLVLLRQVLGALHNRSRATVLLPSFDKSTDDRVPRDVWARVETPVDVLVLEGWCLGATSETSAIVAQPVNALERDEDAQQLWRSYSNQMLKDEYEDLYKSFHLWVMLAAPGFQQVLRWRTEQEHKLHESVSGHGDGLMSAPALARFVQHFERYTRQCLRELPQKVDVLLKMDSDRNVVRTHGLAVDA